MADVYMYADETGNLDYEGGSDKQGASTYFGFGTAVFHGEHGEELWQGQQLRADLAHHGLQLPRGFHAVNDTTRTRNQMFGLIKNQAPRFDMTFLCKSNAYSSVRRQGEMYLYKMAWFLHFKEIATQVAARDDTLYAIVSSLGTNARATAAKTAIEDVCGQVNREIVLCVWDCSTAWGLQVADYGLWAAQRVLEGKRCTWYEPCVRPTLKSFFTPWGQSSAQMCRLSPKGRDPLGLLSPALLVHRINRSRARAAR
ncbi:DUF3800 domain-containing protein [Phytoactinopolyspora halophila]|uniref:DUF3800 domain-containing protein n=1 Tax=Phytoactinopolyspora halophila TaxID=1981511 RepID=UPI001B8ABC98|nr:DUF3800 domain-containing protein [Phytoactinopolyspora halophila]